MDIFYTFFFRNFPTEIFHNRKSLPLFSIFCLYLFQTIPFQTFLQAMSPSLFGTSSTVPNTIWLPVHQCFGLFIISHSFNVTIPYTSLLIYFLYNICLTFNRFWTLVLVSFPIWKLLLIVSKSPFLLLITFFHLPRLLSLSQLHRVKYFQL